MKAKYSMNVLPIPPDLILVLQVCASENPDEMPYMISWLGKNQFQELNGDWKRVAEVLRVLADELDKEKGPNLQIVRDEGEKA